ncbi:iron-sulfur cluster biosynthesis family protein [Paucilactobacillus kaifaensis]|uniref:iron-sulfur cluster biosynthesis family protein n=1 Tax=Paucilactobacillus kaifaensis TaxID=2559921 RepID=UPI0010F5F5D2|nr:iron-sulfur cluster biosynthesis family protein [Paucilactobacillus kaifaensis]
MKLTISESALSILEPKLSDHTNILLSYDDGVGPYSHHGLVALQIAFKLILITDQMPMQDYDLKIDSNLGPIYAKGYSSEFFGSNLKIDFNPHYHLFSLVDDGEVIEDNLEIQDLRK